MKLNAESPIPLYHQLQEILRDKIMRRIWIVGTQLPSEHDLCRTYGVTRPTVRQALEGLVRQGLVSKRRGKGAFVTKPPLPVGLFSVHGTSDAFAAQQVKVETKVLRMDHVSNCAVAEGQDPPHGWARLERVRRINNVAIIFEYTWLHAILVPGLDKIDLNNQSLFHTLEERFELNVDGGRQYFSAVAAPLRVAKALGIRPGEPLLRVVRSLDIVGRHRAPSGTKHGRIEGALRTDLYAAQGPFVLEQTIAGTNFENQGNEVQTQGVFAE